MSTVAALGYKFALSINGTVIGNIVELKPGSRVQETVKVQRNDSSDLYGDKILGWCDVTDWSVKTVWYQSQYATLKGLQGTFQPIVFTRPDGTNTEVGSAAITELGNEVPLKEFMTNTFKLAFTGNMS